MRKSNVIPIVKHWIFQYIGWPQHSKILKVRFVGMIWLFLCLEITKIKMEDGWVTQHLVMVLTHAQFWVCWIYREQYFVNFSDAFVFHNSIQIDKHASTDCWAENAIVWWKLGCVTIKDEQIMEELVNLKSNDRTFWNRNLIEILIYIYTYLLSRCAFRNFYCNKQ